MMLEPGSRSPAGKKRQKKEAQKANCCLTKLSIAQLG
jgi:hypothetical protein